MFESFEVSFSIATYFPDCQKLVWQIEDDSNCTRNYLEIRDGPDEDSYIVGRFCGMDSPGHRMSSKRHLFLKYVIEGASANRGFSFKRVSGKPE